MTLKSAEEEVPGTITVHFKVSGLGTFDLELEPATAVRDVKKLAKELCNIEPEHMRLIYDGRVLKEGETLECYEVGAKIPMQILFTAGHSAMVGGGKPQVQQQ